MTPTKTCELCDTTLEFEDGGQRFAFTAHAPDLCRAGTKYLIANLKQALVDQRETCERAMRQIVRQADKALADAGLETLTQQARRVEVLALATLWREGLIVLPELDH